MKRHFYTDDNTAQIVIALLKAHGIHKVVANPGTTNIAIVGSVQNDSWFEVYSGIDERHSAYMAVGMAAECGEPVVLSCTGATASRNYLPALTEAYYRKLPILAITSMQNFDNVGQLSPQALDRSSCPPDVVKRSFQCRAIMDEKSKDSCVRKINEAILELKRNGGGPVHINLEMGKGLSFNSRELPSVRKIDRVCVEDLPRAPRIPEKAKIAVFFGSGTIAPEWSEFVEKNGAVAFVDEGSCYNGPNRVNAALLCSQNGFKSNPKYADLQPDLIVDVGEMSGNYPVLGYLHDAASVWRVSPDGEIRDRFGRLEYVFAMSGTTFAAHYSVNTTERNDGYVAIWRNADASLRTADVQLPFSNPWIARVLSSRIPAGTILHCGILNSLRSWNLFPAAESVRTFCNVGGFGIDGALSTLAGSSVVRPNVLHLGFLGDLAFFYDMNALGNRHIGKNLRILVVNNGCGTEFNMSFHPGSQFGEQTNDYIAAGGHFGNRAQKVVKAYVESLGFKYISATTKEEFLGVMDEFLVPDMERSVVFECFTEPKDESEAHHIIGRIDPYDTQTGMVPKLKSLVPSRVKNAVKELVK